MVRRRFALLFDFLQFVFELLNRFHELAFAFLPFRHGLGVGFRVKRVGGELGLLTLQLGLERTKATVQAPPAGVDHGAVGPRNLLRLIFAK